MTVLPPFLFDTVTVNEFTGLAQWIASRKPPVKVPSFTINIIRSAIAMRKRCADWFQKQATTEESMPDDMKHSHFIVVLERVLEILKPNSTSESTDSNHEGKHGKSTA